MVVVYILPTQIQWYMYIPRCSHHLSCNILQKSPKSHYTSQFGIISAFIKQQNALEGSITDTIRLGERWLTYLSLTLPIETSRIRAGYLLSACTNLRTMPTCAPHQLMRHAKNHTNIVLGTLFHGLPHVLRCIK